MEGWYRQELQRGVRIMCWHQLGGGGERGEGADSLLRHSASLFVTWVHIMDYSMLTTSIKILHS